MPLVSSRRTCRSAKATPLSDEETWSVAAFINSRERPQDPRFEGSIAETRQAHHDDPLDFYGLTVDGVALGQNAPPSGHRPTVINEKDRLYPSIATGTSPAPSPSFVPTRSAP